MTTQQQSFMNTIGPMAIKSWQDTKIVIPSITVAQGILESGWGKSTLTINANNLFGIKAGKEWAGESYNIITTEYYNGVRKEIVAAFRKYRNWQESVDDHTAFLNKPRYQALHGKTNYKEVAKLLKQCGYATGPTYDNSLIRLIELYKLDQYDKNANAPLPESNVPAAGSILYTVQVGAYSMQRNAATMQRHLATLGYNGYIVYNEKDKLYRVQVGSFSVKANAERQMADIKSKGLNAILVQKTK